MTLGHRIRQLREDSHMAQKELAARLHIANSTMSQYESGERVPSDEMKLKIADLFGVSVDYLLGRPRVVSNNAIRVPVLGSIPAGIPLEAIEDIIDWEEVPHEMAAGGKTYFALQVKGDSMYPNYLPGDVVIVRRTECCDSGADCVVYVNGYDATLKQIKLGEHGEITLVPRNSSYPPRTFTAEEVASLPVQIAGVVVELRRKV